MPTTSSLRPLWLAAVLALTGCAIESDELSDQEAADLYEDAYEQEQDGKADNASCSGVVVPDRTPFDKVVAFTFDDGPNPTTTPMVLETLRRHNVPATFFVTGNRFGNDASASLAEEIAADPLFLLANHTWSHPNMTTISASRVASQIDDTGAAIESVGGTPRFFRFPYGASTCATAAAVRERGYAISGWHIDSADWCFSTGTPGVCPASTFRYVDNDLRNDMKGYVMRQVRARGGGILLFHDIHAYTAQQLEGIIQTLKDEGYRFTNLDDTAVFPLLNGVTPEPQPQPEPTGDQARTTSALNLRSGPGSDYNVLLTMPQGAVVDLLGERAEPWVKLSYQGTVGWAHEGYLESL